MGPDIRRLCKIQNTRTGSEHCDQSDPADLPKEARCWICQWRSSLCRRRVSCRTSRRFGKVSIFSLEKLGSTERSAASGILSIALATEAGQNLIVPAGNERECALITAAVGHEKCAISAVSTLKEVIDFFGGKGIDERPFPASAV